MPAFHKRFYTPATFVRDLIEVMKHMPDLAASARSGRVSHEFSEKIMLAVTQVNGCRYCSYFHAKMAIRSGMDEGEIEKLLAQEIGDFPKREAVALAFVQHYAESGGHPDPEVEQRFRAYYGPEMSRDIMNYVRMITLGNLAGNTVDAFLSRLKGQPAVGSHPLGEFVLFLLFAPFTLPLLKRIKQRT